MKTHRKFIKAALYPISVWSLAASLFLIGSGNARTEGGCAKGPGPRCLHIPCFNSDPICFKFCTIDYMQGFGECQYNGDSESACYELQVQAYPIWIYPGTCVNSVCVYGEREVITFSGLMSFSDRCGNTP